MCKGGGGCASYDWVGCFLGRNSYNQEPQRMRVVSGPHGRRRVEAKPPEHWRAQFAEGECGFQWLVFGLHQEFYRSDRSGTD